MSIDREDSRSDIITAVSLILSSYPYFSTLTIFQFSNFSTFSSDTLKSCVKSRMMALGNKGTHIFVFECFFKMSFLIIIGPKWTFIFFQN